MTSIIVPMNITESNIQIKEPQITSIISYNKEKCLLVNDPLKELENSNIIIIQSNPSCISFLCGVPENMQILTKSSDGTHKIIFRASCFAGCGLCGSRCSNLSCKIQKVSAGNDINRTLNILSPNYLSIYRPSCGCCDCGHEYTFFLSESKQPKILGKLVSPGGLCNCNPEYKILNDSQNVIYTIKVSLCQSGVFMGRSFCCAGSPAKFEILKQGNVVGYIQKKESSCCNFLRNIHINLPAKCSLNEKLMLMCAGIVFDNMFFE